MHKYQKYVNEGMAVSDAISMAFESDIDKDVREFTESVGMHSSSLFSIVERIIEEFVPAKSIEIDNPFITAFQDVIVDYSSKNIPSIHAFIKWWNDRKDKISIATPTNVDAIKVMTIHKSKGLEFPVVIIPFASWDLGKNKGVLWTKPCHIDGIPEDIEPPVVAVKFKKDLLETPLKDAYVKEYGEACIDNINKTYVAFTRAEKEMHIYAPLKVKDNAIKVNSYLQTVLKSVTLQEEIGRAHV